MSVEVFAEPNDEFRATPGVGPLGRGIDRADGRLPASARALIAALASVKIHPIAAGIRLE